MEDKILKKEFSAEFQAVPISIEKDDKFIKKILKDGKEQSKEVQLLLVKLDNNKYVVKYFTVILETGVGYECWKVHDDLINANIEYEDFKNNPK